MFFRLFENVTTEDKDKAIETLISQSSPSRDYFLMVVLSVAMATFGIIMDSTVVLIGSMLIAPLLYPVITLSLGITMSDESLIKRSFYVLVKSIVLSLVVSFIIGIFFGMFGGDTQNILTQMTRAKFLFLSVIVASISGFIASFSLVKPKLSEVLPGVAISISLIPPLAGVGYGISKFRWDFISGASLVFLLNIFGIVFASMLVFSFLNFYVKRRLAHKVIKKEDEILAKENAKPTQNINSDLSI